MPLDTFVDPMRHDTVKFMGRSDCGYSTANLAGAFPKAGILLVTGSGYVAI